MHWQAGTGWLFPIMAVALTYYTGLYWFLFLWIAEYMWGNFLLLCRTLLDADDLPSISQSCAHVCLALVYFIVLTLVGWATFSFTIIGWRDATSVLEAGRARDRGENPRRSLKELASSWFGK